MSRRWAFLRVFFLAHHDPMNGGPMWTWNFWKQALERSIKTAAQFALVFFGADAFNIFEMNVMDGAGFAAAGAVVSILTSMASEPYKERGTPSMVGQD